MKFNKNKVLGKKFTKEIEKGTSLSESLYE